MNSDDEHRGGLPHASAWARYEKCSGSFQLERKAIELGQVAHTGSPAQASGLRIHGSLNGQKIELSAEEETAADALEDLSRAQAARIFGDQPYQQLNEKRLWSGGMFSGQFDRCFYMPELALVQDFKTSHVEPEPAEVSAQLRVLSVLVAIALPTVKEVVAQIVSPYFGVTEARYDLHALSDAYTGILRTLAAIRDERARLVPGVIQCRFCPAILICQAVKDTIAPIATLQVSALPADGERAARLLDEVELLEKHLEEIKMYYKGRASQDPNLQIPGYGMVPGAQVREISDWGKAREILRKYVPDRDLEGVPTLTQLQVALKKTLKLPSPKAAAEKLNLLLEGVMTLKQNAPSFRRISGKATIAELAEPLQPLHER
jgi:hypothetical protein